MRLREVDCLLVLRGQGAKLGDVRLQFGDDPASGLDELSASSGTGRLRNRLQREYDDCQDASDQESFMSGYARKTQPQLAEDRTLELWVCANIDVRASKRLAPKRRRFDAVSDETIGGCIASNHSHVSVTVGQRSNLRLKAGHGTVNERYRINFRASTMGERRNGISAPFYRKGSVLVGTGKARVADHVRHQGRGQFPGQKPASMM